MSKSLDIPNAFMLKLTKESKVAKSMKQLLGKNHYMFQIKETNQDTLVSLKILRVEGSNRRYRSFWFR